MFFCTNYSKNTVFLTDIWYTLNDAVADNKSRKEPDMPKILERITISKGKRGDFSPVQSDHYHTFYELFYLNFGKCRFLLKDTVYQLEKGDLVLICPGDLHHAVYSSSPSCEIIILCFRKEDLEWQKMKHMISNVRLSEPHSFMGSIPALYQEEFTGILTRMLAENAQIDEYSEGFMGCYLLELMLMLMRHSVMNEEEPDLLNSRDADILTATKYIYKNYRKPLSLEEVSAQAALSPTYFSKKFKQVTGMGFKEYLNFVRLRHAQTALLTTDNTITDIALENGFNDSNYFKDLFKKVYGKSPREFRKSKS